MIKLGFKCYKCKAYFVMLKTGKLYCKGCKYATTLEKQEILEEKIKKSLAPKRKMKDAIQENINERLGNLKRMLAKGLITQEEYNKKIDRNNNL